MEQKFYVCNVCGNLIIKLNDSGLTPVCCGRDMVELEAAVTDGDIEKHVPVYSYAGNTVTVKVGATPHPMTPEHYIRWIFVNTDKGNHVYYLEPGDEPEVTFELSPSEHLEEVFEYCNIHKLWKA